MLLVDFYAKNEIFKIPKNQKNRNFRAKKHRWYCHLSRLLRFLRFSRNSLRIHAPEISRSKNIICTVRKLSIQRKIVHRVRNFLLGLRPRQVHWVLRVKNIFLLSWALEPRSRNLRPHYQLFKVILQRGHSPTLLSTFL